MRAHDRYRGLSRTALGMLLWLALATGCGFHLRGNYLLPSELRPVHVSSGEGSGLGQALRLALASSDVAVSDDPTKAKLFIRIVRESFDRRVLSVDGRGKVIEYELIYKFEFEVADASGKVLVPRRNFELTRAQINPQTEVLGKLEEEALIREDLQRDASDRVLQQIRVQLG
jgi:LPS-assembly lipoprotein